MRCAGGFLFIVFDLFSLILPSRRNHSWVMTIPQEQLFNYLALGDSYTIGESVQPEDRWSYQLARLLRSKSVNISDPDIIARTGWTTSELSEAVKNARNTKRYSLVTLLIGVNNQYRGEDIEKFKKEFHNLLATAISFANGNKDHVMVLSIPDWGVTPFASNRDQKKIAAEIDAFNEVIVKECKGSGVLFVDITALSRTAKGNPAMVASDGLHFSGKMYTAWAELLLPEVRKILRKD